MKFRLKDKLIFPMRGRAAARPPIMAPAKPPMLCLSQVAVSLPAMSRAESPAGSKARSISCWQETM